MTKQPRTEPGTLEVTPDHIGVRSIIPMMEVASIEIDEMRKSKIGAVARFGLLGLAARCVGTAIAVGTKDGETAYFTVDAEVTRVRAALGPILKQVGL